ncbi:MAG: type IV pilus secretin PilQ, partial [Desulfohalobiaceae bacterium]
RYVTPTDFEDQVGTGDLLRDEAGFTGDMDLSMISARLPGSILYSQLQTLESEGKVNILSSPSITTMDNQMAFTDHGEKVPYETVDEDGDRNVQFEDASLRLEVVPSLIDGEHMMMDIKVLKDEVDFTRDVQGNPVIRTKETETNLVVRDGETIVISGLSKQTVSDRERGILGLRQLPGLGWLFKDQNLDDEMEEFMIFITPSILSPQGES